MPVYIVSCTENSKVNRYHFLRLWTKAIKGPVDHIELVFTSDENFMKSYWVTYRSKTVRYAARDYTITKEHYTLLWYKLNNISFDTEMHLRTFCEKKSKENIHMSYIMMITSALPIVFSFIIRFWIGINETAATSKADVNALCAHDDKKKYHFCASLVIEAFNEIKQLNDIDGKKCTANDVIVHALSRNLIQSCPEPLVKKQTNADNSMPGIIRSRSWV
jgi:hypothetical protein